jgi:hypothetical protein
MTQEELERHFPDFVGQAFGPPEVGLDTVNEPMIRHWCETMGDANPVYLDPGAAKTSRHGKLVAPPTMMQAWTMAGYPMSAATTRRATSSRSCTSCSTRRATPAWSRPTAARSTSAISCRAIRSPRTR